MVVLECQALGTPVLTTNYTAMRDYTRLGIAVESAAHEPINGAKFAVRTCGGARKPYFRLSCRLARVFSIGLTPNFRWIQCVESLCRFSVTQNQSTRSVKRCWRRIHSRRNQFSPSAMTCLTRGWDTPWTLYHHPDVEVDYEKLQKVLIDASKHHYAFAIAQTTQMDGFFLARNTAFWRESSLRGLLRG